MYERFRWRLEFVPKIPRILLPIWWIVYAVCGILYLAIKFILKILSVLKWLFTPGKERKGLSFNDLKTMTAKKSAKKGEIRK